MSCPAAAAAFGFRPLSKALKSGRGLIGFGIVSDASVGEKMFQDMARLSEWPPTGFRLLRPECQRRPREPANHPESDDPPRRPRPWRPWRGPTGAAPARPPRHR